MHSGSGSLQIEIPRATHWWNFWVCGIEAAIFIAASQMMGPMTLIPFLFKQTGIDDAWLGLFTISTLIAAVGGPIGTGWTAGYTHRLPFCLRVGFLQRIPFLAVPLGVYFFFSSPGTLLVILVTAWVVSNFFMGVGFPIYQVVLTSGTREAWWGRMLSLRSILGAAVGLVSTLFVWWVNRHTAVPHNYILLGTIGVGLLFVSLYVVSRFREVPARIEGFRGREGLAATLQRMRQVLRSDARVRWLVVARVFRSCGFVIGTYITAVFIQRCGLTEAQMWIPLGLTALSEISAHLVGGWFVDRYGPKPALVLSAVLTFVNSFALMHCHSTLSFIVLFPFTSLGGSLLTNSWVTYMVKLSPTEQRSNYVSTVTLASAPGSILTSLAGVILVRCTGFDDVFYLSAAGGLVAALLFLTKLPHLRPELQSNTAATL